VRLAKLTVASFVPLALVMRVAVGLLAFIGNTGGDVLGALDFVFVASLGKDGLVPDFSPTTSAGMQGSHAPAWAMEALRRGWARSPGTRPSFPRDARTRNRARREHRRRIPNEARSPRHSHDQRQRHEGATVSFASRTLKRLRPKRPRKPSSPCPSKAKAERDCRVPKHAANKVITKVRRMIKPIKKTDKEVIINSESLEIASR